MYTKQSTLHIIKLALNLNSNVGLLSYIVTNCHMGYNKHNPKIFVLLSKKITNMRSHFHHKVSQIKETIHSGTSIDRVFEFLFK